MRVIAGSARRIQLKTPNGLKTRPTTDRIKETLFNILHPYLADSIFLDLFSGSGAIGIEALSRGAKEAVFVENNKEAISCIKDNLIVAKLKLKATVIPTDVIESLYYLEGKKKTFDLIYLDPPYGKGYEQKIFSYLYQSSLLKEGLIIFETALETELDVLESLDFKIEKIKKYKTNQHIFIRK